MKKQILITIGREYGSGGHDLAALLSQRLGIRMLDRELIDELWKMTRKCSVWPRNTMSGR